MNTKQMSQHIEDVVLSRRPATLKDKYAVLSGIHDQLHEAKIMDLDPNVRLAVIDGINSAITINEATAKANIEAWMRDVAADLDQKLPKAKAAGEDTFDITEPLP